MSGWASIGIEPSSSKITGPKDHIYTEGSSGSTARDNGAYRTSEICRILMSM